MALCIACGIAELTLKEEAEAVVAEEGPRRNAALAAAGVQWRRGTRNRPTTPATTPLLALRGQKGLLEGVRLLAAVLGDPDGLQTVRRASKLTMPLKLVWHWAGELAAWENRRHEHAADLPAGWQESMPFEEAPSVALLGIRTKCQALSQASSTSSTDSSSTCTHQ